MKKLLLIGLGFILLIVGCWDDPKRGCLDIEACNYAADATIDDINCIYRDTVIVESDTLFICP